MYVSGVRICSESLKAVYVSVLYFCASLKRLLKKVNFNQFCTNIPGLPYKASIAEDTPVESTLFQAIEVTDADLVGDVLDVQCVHRPGFEEGVCDSFEIQPRRLETDHDMFRGSVILKKPLDYRLVC